MSTEFPFNPLVYHRMIPDRSPITAAYLNAITDGLRALGRSIPPGSITTPDGIFQRPSQGGGAGTAGFRARIVVAGPAAEPDYADARYWVREVLLSYNSITYVYAVTYGTKHVTATNMTEFGSGVQIGGGDQTYGFGNHALLDYPRRVLEALAAEANAGPNPPDPPWTWTDVPIEDVMPIFVWVTADAAGGYTFERYPEPSFQRYALDVPCLDADGNLTDASKWWGFDPRSADAIDDADGAGVTLPECGA